MVRLFSDAEEEEWFFKRHSYDGFLGIYISNDKLNDPTHWRKLRDNLPLTVNYTAERHKEVIAYCDERISATERNRK